MVKVVVMKFLYLVGRRITYLRGCQLWATLEQVVEDGGSTYEPLSSVWEGNDGELLEAMLSFYPSINPEPILDATYNAGRFALSQITGRWSV